MRHVLYVNSPSYLGGAEISLLALMRRVRSAQYEPFLLTSAYGKLASQAQLNDIPVAIQEFPWFSRSKPWEYIGSVYHLIRLIRRNQIDLVHTNCDRCLTHVSLACRLSRVPYVSHVRDYVRAWFKYGRLTALNRAELVITNSHFLAQYCNRAGVDAARLVTVYNPFDLESFRLVSETASERSRADLGIDPEALVVGCVGQIQPLKGQRELVQACLHLLAAGHDMHVVVVGNAAGESAGGPNTVFLDELKSEIGASPYAGRFHFTGVRNDIPELMKAMDIVVVPSWLEAFGRVVVEGMTAGCAVIGTTVGGIPEIITHGRTGLLVPPKNAQALSEAILRLAGDPSLCQALSVEAQRTVERFDCVHHVEKIVTLYDAVLAYGTI